MRAAKLLATMGVDFPPPPDFPLFVAFFHAGRAGFDAMVGGDGERLEVGAKPWNPNDGLA